MDEGETLARYGLPPRAEALPAIRAELADLTRRERAAYEPGGTTDDEEGLTWGMKECAILLFAAGHVEDALLIWRAKRSSMDAGCSIDVQLLCGAGLAATLRHLRELATDDARAAAAYIESCVAADDFEGGDEPGGRLAGLLAAYRVYFGLT